MGTGPFTFVEHVQGRLLGGQALRRLLPTRASPISTATRPIFVKATAAITGSGRAGRRGVPRQHSVRARPAGAKRWGTRSGRSRAPGSATSWSSSTPRGSRSTTRACARRCRSRSTAGAARGLSKHLDPEHVGGVVRPGYRWRCRRRSSRSCRASPRTSRPSREEAKKLLEEAGVRTSSSSSSTATSPMPYTPAGVYLIDQWRRDRRRGRARAARDQALYRRAAERQLRRRASTSRPIHGRSHLQLAKFLSQ